MLRLRALILIVLCACAPAPNTTPEAATPVDAVIAAGYAAEELAKGSPETTTLGWHLEVTGEKAKYYACDDETSCGMRVIEIPATEVKAVKVVGRARPTLADRSLAGECDVLRITLMHPFSTSRGGVGYDTNRGLVINGGSK